MFLSRINKTNLKSRVAKKSQETLSSINRVQKSINDDVKDLERELVYIRTQPAHPRDRLKRRIQNIEIKSEALAKVLKVDNDDIINELQEIRAVPTTPFNKLKHTLNQFNYDLSNVKKEIITISDDDFIILSDVVWDKDYQTQDSDIDFYKITPNHPKHRLRRQNIQRKIKEENDYETSDVEFITQRPRHPRDRLKTKVNKKNIVYVSDKSNSDVEFINEEPAVTNISDDPS